MNLFKNCQTREIHEEGRAKRQEAEVELQNIEKELKDKILEINVKKED